MRAKRPGTALKLVDRRGVVVVRLNESQAFTPVKRDSSPVQQAVAESVADPEDRASGSEGGLGVQAGLRRNPPEAGVYTG